MRRITSSIGRQVRWHPVSVTARLVAHALRNGLWRSLSPRSRKTACEQRVLTCSTALPNCTESSDIVRYLRQAALRVHEGGNAFYLPPQPGLAKLLGAAVDRYPPGSGFKVLRDFRGLEQAHYLHPQRQTRLRRRLIGTPRDQLIAANYLHHLRLGPRVWDVCVLRAGPVPMPAFVVQHVEGTAPNADECRAFISRLRAALAQTELRISVPDWERNKDFRCPTCNHNLLRDGGGALNYIDFQNFTIRNPQRMLASSSWINQSLRRRPPSVAGARFETLCRLLREHGVELHDRVVLDIGCQTGERLRRALSAGAWWAVGWDRPDAAIEAQRIAVALAFTRLDVVPAAVDADYDVGASIPDWLRPHLDESIVFVRAVAPRLAIAACLIDLPWRAFVYEADPGETLTEVSERLRAFTARGARLAHQTVLRDADSQERPVFLLTRESAAATALAQTFPH